MDEINKIEAELEVLYREESALSERLAEIEDHIRDRLTRKQDLYFRQVGMWYLMPVCVTQELLDHRQQIGQMNDRFQFGQIMWVEQVAKERDGDYMARLATDLYDDRRVAGSFGGVPLDIVKSMRQAYLESQPDGEE